MRPLVTVLAVLIGFGSGWLAFGRDSGAPSMSTAQEEIWAELEASGTYDPGSVQLAGSKYGVDAWKATKNHAEALCLLLTRGEQRPTETCTAHSDENAFSRQAAMNFEEDGERYSLWALIIHDVDGREALLMRREQAQGMWDWRSQFDPDEVAVAELIAGEGIDPEWLSIVGYDGDTPVWVYQAEQTCVIVVPDGAGIESACAAHPQDDESLELHLGEVSYSVAYSTDRAPVLTVIRHAAAVRVPCEADACESIDDKTGDIE